MTLTSKFVGMASSSNFFGVVLFLLSRLVTDPSFMSISWLAVELWKFPFIRNWQEIRKSWIPQSELCLISGDWGKFGIPNLAQMSLIKCYRIGQNAGVKAFSFSVIIGKPTERGGGTAGSIACFNLIKWSWCLV